jgi:hypothetical protein
MRFVATLLLLGAVSGQTLTTRTFGGSGNDSVTGIALDGSGDIYVTGTTTSFDLSLLHPWQVANTGTALVYSTGSNQWGSAVCRLGLQRAEEHRRGTTLQRDWRFARRLRVTAIVVDPTAPQTVYVSAPGAGVFKSTDGGATWNAARGGLPATTGGSLTMDPPQRVTSRARGFLRLPFSRARLRRCQASYRASTRPIFRLATVRRHPYRFRSGSSP